MPSIKELRQKILSLKNTSKITSAMKLVSSSKLKKAQDAWTRNLVYTDSLKQLTNRILQTGGVSNVALLKKTDNVQKITVLVLSTDKGLCGSFNSGLMKSLQAKVKGEWKDYNVDVVAVGKKGSDFFMRRCPVSDLKPMPGFPAKVPYSIAQKLGNEIIAKFLSKKCDIVYLAYNHFNSMVSQEPRTEQLLPLVIPEVSKGKIHDYLMEPEESAIYDRLFPQTVHANIYRAMLSTALGEQAARMNAMDNATRNSKDLISRYTLVMNRARQSAITTELSEIVAGAESIKT